jgi:uncharacterized protein YydD (DUF2326 family)
MKKLNELIKERDDYIADHPHLKEFQKEIDSVLEKVGSDPKTRLEALAIITEGKVLELQIMLRELNIQLKDKLKCIKNGE